MEKQAMERRGLSSFSLKIIAMVSMLIDHFAYSVLYRAGLWGAAPALKNVYYICRFAGRMAFPLYVFMLSEGLFYTHSRKAYVARLWKWAFIMYGINTLVRTAIVFTPFEDHGLFSYNAFVDLALYATLIFFLEHENKKLRPLALFPVLYIALNLILEKTLLPDFEKWAFVLENMHADYKFGGLLIFLSFYLTKKHLLKKSPDTAADGGVKKKQILAAAGAFLFLAVLNIILIYSAIGPYLEKEMTYADAVSRAAYRIFSICGLYYLTPVWGIRTLEGSFFGILALLPISLYDGRIGYHKPWFRKFEYWYYPIHVYCLAGIAAIVITLM